jgi:hypothetical protein
VTSSSIVLLVPIALVVHEMEAEDQPKGGPRIKGDNSEFVADVTVPDESVVRPGEVFLKVWRLRNIGSVRWEGRYLVRQGENRGPGVCTSVARVQIPDTIPLATVDISVRVTAPRESGVTCRVYWKMTDAAGRLYFPDKDGVWFVVKVA